MIRSSNSRLPHQALFRFTSPSSFQVRCTLIDIPVSVTRFRDAYCAPLTPKLGQKFKRSYYGEGTIFYVEARSADQWFQCLQHGYILVESEIRIRRPPFTFGVVRRLGLTLELRQFANMIEVESRKRLYSYSTLRDPIVSLKFPVAFGEHHKMMWVSLSQLRRDASRSGGYSTMCAQE